MSKYKYTAKASTSVSLKTAKEALDVVLHTNEEVELPADHIWVKGLVKKGYLVEVAQPAPKEEKK